MEMGFNQIYNSAEVLLNYSYSVSEEVENKFLTLIHGFTGSGKDWELQISGGFLKVANLILPDVIGHGESGCPNDLQQYYMQNLVKDLSNILEGAFTSPTTLLGYSLGGRLALRFALAYPHLVEALILESASPGIKDETERQKRIESDNALADFIEREGVETFVNYWESLPLWESQKHLPQAVLAKQRQQRLNNNPVGLANSLRGAGAGVELPLYDQLPKLTMPVLIVVGELDTKYCAIGREMQELIPHARLEIVPSAGHNVHLEKPEIFNRLVLNFLNER
jgi:2-succinyl-6-hydroxy-2,4-cyclohexadiene-1-carboxylate synthase